MDLGGPGPKARCKKCGDVVQSMDRWNFKWCKGKHFALDGGDSYTKIVGDINSIEWLEKEEKSE